MCANRSTYGAIIRIGFSCSNSSGNLCVHFRQITPEKTWIDFLSPFSLNITMISSILATWANICSVMMVCHRLTDWLTFSQSAYNMCMPCAVNLNKLRLLCVLEKKQIISTHEWIIFIFRIGSIFPCRGSHSEATRHETNSSSFWHLSSELS